MKKTILLIGLIALLAACKNEQKKTPSTPVVVSPAAIDSFLVTDSSWGLIDAGTNVEKLRTIFGEENIGQTRTHQRSTTEVDRIREITRYERVARTVDCD